VAAVTPQEYVEEVLRLVESIPEGRVMSYGAVADALADRSGRNSPRQVGTIMARHGGGVPWHRVVTSSGRMPPGHEQEARQRLTMRPPRYELASVGIDNSRMAASVRRPAKLGERVRAQNFWRTARSK